jgi:hypothetical protein
LSSTWGKLIFPFLFFLRRTGSTKKIVSNYLVLPASPPCPLSSPRGAGWKLIYQNVDQVRCLRSHRIPRWVVGSIREGGLKRGLWAHRWNNSYQFMSRFWWWWVVAIDTLNKKVRCLTRFIQFLLSWTRRHLLSYSLSSFWYPTISYYWTVPLILDHSYLVGNLTSSKIADTKVSGF